jgi:hypothetical protein
LGHAAFIVLRCCTDSQLVDTYSRVGGGDNEGSNTDSKHSGDADASDSGKGGISAAPLHATSKRVFSNAHAYHINSLATNSDGQTFVSADDLRINWWDLETSDTCFSKYM